jgi:hypothetical protein
MTGAEMESIYSNLLFISLITIHPLHTPQNIPKKTWSQESPCSSTKYSLLFNLHEAFQTDAVYTPIHKRIPDSSFQTNPEGGMLHRVTGSISTSGCHWCTEEIKAI